MRSAQLVIATVIACMLGCDATETENNPQTGLRIVSMSPGISHTVIDAGFGEHIVGRSPFCFLVDQETPVVGDLRTIDYERLLKLAPTHVFVQQTVSGVDIHLLELADQGKFELFAWPLDHLSDIRRTFGDLTEMFGDRRMEVEMSLASSCELPSPLLVITQGVEGNAGLSFGSDTYIDDLMQVLGVENAVKQSGWISLSLEDIGRLNPKAIVVIADNQIKERDLRAIRTLGIPVIPFVHEHVLVPSSYIREVAEEFSQLNMEQ